MTAPPRKATLLRVYCTETDCQGSQPLYERIVEQARQLHLAGATVLRGVMGFGRHSRMHTAKILRLSEDLPVVVEIVDSRQKLQPLLEYLRQHLPEGLVTLTDVEVLGGEAAESGAD